ncbi:MAG: DUF2179 domain-containing protein [Trueperaceae bacterium]|nr:MAG: DUF2179 domain-containing protein [Trueperaceae bacterium]
MVSSLLIFGLRLADVSVSTVRLIVLVRGQRLLAGILSFVSSIIWLVAVAQVINELDNPLKVVAYAGGFAVGTALGSTIANRVARGHSLVRIITPVAADDISQRLREAGFFVTVLNAEGRDGEVRIAFSVIPRRRVKEVIHLINEANPRAFVTVEEVSAVHHRLIPAEQHK